MQDGGWDSRIYQKHEQACRKQGVSKGKAKQRIEKNIKSEEPSSTFWQLEIGRKHGFRI